MEKYAVVGITYTGKYFTADTEDADKLYDIKEQIGSTVGYFGGGSVTVYKVNNVDNDIYIFDYENI